MHVNANTGRVRNLNRGLRSRIATENRKQKRSLRRRKNRRLHREYKRVQASAQEPVGSWDDFKAEKERELEFGKLKQKTDLKITAWNITILQKGDREEIEDYLGKDKIKLAVVTETRKT